MPFVSGGGAGGLPGVVASGTPAANQALIATSSSAATWKYPPGFEIGYDQITAGVNIASTTEASGTTIITCAAHTFDGTPVVVEFFSPEVLASTVASSEVVISLFEGATQITRLGILQTVTAGGTQLFQVWYSRYRFTPTAGSHTYTITAFATSTTGTPKVDAGSGGTGGNAPAFCRFTKV